MPRVYQTETNWNDAVQAGECTLPSEPKWALATPGAVSLNPPMIDRRGIGIGSAAKNAALVAGIVTAGLLVSAAIRGVGHGSVVSGEKWIKAFLFSASWFTVTFLIFFLWNLIRVVLAKPLNDVLAEETPEADLLRSPLYGFVAMEFYALILNRTFLVFVAPDGLYGWKATGPVTNSDRRYFAPLQEMVQDPELMRDIRAIRKLAALRGGFFFARTEIASVQSDDRGQWGMGGIDHSGHVQVRLVSDKKRKFILLGETIPEEVRDRISSVLCVGIPSSQ